MARSLILKAPYSISTRGCAFVACINNQEDHIISFEITRYNLRWTLLQFVYTYKYYKTLYKTRRLDLIQNAAPFITQCADHYKMLQKIVQNV